MITKTTPNLAAAQFLPPRQRLRLERLVSRIARHNIPLWKAMQTARKAARALDGHPATAGILNDALAKISSHAGAHRSSSAVTRSGIGCNVLLDRDLEETWQRK